MQLPMTNNLRRRSMAKPLDQDELVIIVDENNREIGVATRKEMRKKRLIHRATYILIVDGKKRILCQKRSLKKDIYPGMWEIAAGGVIAKGESYSDSAKRELKEETGINCPELKMHAEFFFEDEKNRVFGGLFSCRFSGSIRPQEEEVENFRFLSQKELETFMKKEPFTPDSTFIYEKFIKDLLRQNAL